MTVSTNPTPDLQRDQIVAAAYGICGLVPAGGYPTPDEIDRGSLHFRMALLSLQAEGILLTASVRDTLDLVDGTTEYELDSDTIDVEVGNNDTIGTIVPADGSAETIVRTMSRSEWMEIAQKTSIEGKPSRCYIDKSGTVLTAVFWPTPDDSTLDFRYTKVRLLRDNDTGSSTLELKRTWAPYLMYATAVNVARDNSKFELARDFRSEANAELARCKAGDVQHGSLRLRVGHCGQNW